MTENTSGKRYAIVTGASKGRGLEIRKQLGYQGILVVLTTKDEKRGIEAIEEIKGFSLFDRAVFHQLGVEDFASIASLAEFVKIRHF